VKLADSWTYDDMRLRFGIGLRGLMNPSAYGHRATFGLARLEMVLIWSRPFSATCIDSVKERHNP
jgi:hypothetical protein